MRGRQSLTGNALAPAPAESASRRLIREMNDDQMQEETPQHLEIRAASHPAARSILIPAGVAYVTVYVIGAASPCLPAGSDEAQACKPPYDWRDPQHILEREMSTSTAAVSGMPMFGMR